MRSDSPAVSLLMVLSGWQVACSSQPSSEAAPPPTSHVVAADSLEPATPRYVTVGSELCAKISDRAVGCVYEVELVPSVVRQELPTSIPEGESVVHMVGHARERCVLTAPKGHVACWTRRGQDDYAMLPLPEQGFVDIAGDVDSLCRLRSTGEVVCHGDNRRGELGGSHGEKRDVSHAVVVELPGPAIDIAAESGQRCALLKTGDVHCWGRAQWDGTADTDVAQVKQLGDVAALMGVGRVRLRSGEVVTWKPSEDPAMRFTTPEPEAPTDRCVLRSNTVACNGEVVLDEVDEFDDGLHSRCARKHDGSVWCWGERRGEVPYMTPAPDTLLEQPKRVEGLPPIASVHSSRAGTCAVSVAGDVWCWGDTRWGFVESTALSGQSDWIGTPHRIELPGTVSSLFATREDALCSMIDEHTWCWNAALPPTDFGGPHDSNARRSRALCSTHEGASRCEVLGLQGPKVVPTIDGPLGPQEAWHGETKCVRDGSDARCETVYDRGEVMRLQPMPTVPATRDSQLVLAGNAVCSLDGGHARCANLAGRNKDAFVVDEQDVTEIDGTSFIGCIRRANGTVACWISPFFDLGGFSATLTDVPVLDDVIDVAPSRAHACALRRDQSVWCWGDGSMGQLGNGGEAWVSTHRPIRMPQLEASN